MGSEMCIRDSVCDMLQQNDLAGGFGGIQHCLIPAPKHVIIDRDKDDNEYYTRLFAKEQSYRSMLRILGY